METQIIWDNPFVMAISSIFTLFTMTKKGGKTYNNFLISYTLTLYNTYIVKQLKGFDGFDSVN